MMLAQIRFNDRIEPDRLYLRKLEPSGDSAVHSQGKCFDDQSVARLEVQVKAAVRPTNEFHQIGHAHPVGSLLKETIRGHFDDPTPGMQLLVFHVTHQQLRGNSRRSSETTRDVFISPFFSERTKLGKE